MNTEVLLVRHGEPVLKNALLGSTDSPLSDLGWQQLENTFANLGEFDQLIASPLSRCASFAQHFASEYNVPLLIEEQWRECHFGDWDGRRYQELHQRHPEAVSEFFNDPARFPPPNGEVLTEFNQRVDQALSQLVKRNPGKRVVVLTHAGVIRSLVGACLGMSRLSNAVFQKFSVDYASVTHLSIFHDESQRWFSQLVKLNQTTHLAESPLP